MNATPSWIGLLLVLLLFMLVVGGLFAMVMFLVKRPQANGGKSRSGWLWLMIPVVVISGVSMLMCLGLVGTYRFQAHNEVIQATEIEQLQQANSASHFHHENGSSSSDHKRVQEIHIDSHGPTPTVHRAKFLTIGGLFFLLLIGGACCFAFYVLLVSRKPAQGTPFRPQSMFWLFPVVGMWGLAGLLFAQNVSQHRGYTSLNIKPEPNLLMEHAGFAKKEDLLSWYVKSGPYSEEKVTENEEVIEPYPGWISEAQEWSEKTDQYQTPAAFVLAATGSTEKEAVNRALEKAAPRVIDFYRREHQTGSGTSHIPQEYLAKTMTDLYAVKGTVHTAPGDSFEMYRVWVRCFIETDDGSKAYRYWKESLIQKRAVVLLSFIGFLLINFIVLTIYLRLNRRSERKFQNRLRFATLVVLIPVGLVVCGILTKIA